MAFPEPIRACAPDAQGFPVRPSGTDRLPGLRSRLRFPPEVFAAVVGPLIDGLAEYLARPARGLVAPDGSADDPLTLCLLFAHRALAVRHERILPPNAAPETVGDLAHRWTYAVLVAGILRQDHAHGAAVPAQLFGHLVPELGRRWLGEDAAVNAALADVLAERVRVGNPIEAILRNAASVSWPCRVSSSGSQGRSVDPGVLPPSVSDLNVSSAEARLTSTTSGASAAAPAPSGTQASEFIAWLCEGVATRTIEVNAAGGLVHRVPEGLLLAWPDLFQSFLETHSPEPATVRALKRLRQSLFAAGWHLQGKGGVVVHDYIWRRESGVICQVSGVVVTAVDRLIDPLPPVHPALVRIEPSADATS